MNMGRCSMNLVIVRIVLIMTCKVLFLEQGAS